ncbi:Uncharacterized protein M6B38_211740 [Iris pallida]|uniref:UspA domain-containing protein n=1 Tax=Iris pallida TaxID=29817 RepID=A0AAX6E364_IRIPA|nr:Uncharacterized protein M6B38_211740 [Iris pallida]
MGSEANGESFLRQLSLGGGGGGGGNQGLWNYSSPPSSSSSYYTATKCGGGTGVGSKRWGKKKSFSSSSTSLVESEQQQLGGINGGVKKKRVIVVVDNSTRAEHATMWALTHIANRGDLLTLLHVIPHHPNTTTTATRRGEDAPNLANSLGSLCKACKPQVEVEALVIQGPKLATVLSQVKKLEAAVLVLSQSKPSPFCCLLRSGSEEFVEQCIDKAECLTLAVRKQRKGVGGYLVSTRWQKNFWLLA